MPRTLLERCVDAHHAYLELGNRTRPLDGASLVANADCPDLYDANCVVRITAEGRAEVDELIADVERHVSAMPHRCYKVDPLTSPSVEARLVVDGYRPTVEVQMVLLGDLGSSGPEVDIRPVVHDVDWQSLHTLMQAHDRESATRRRVRWPDRLTDQMWEQKRVKAPDVQFFLAHVDNRDCGYFSSWPGAGGVGIVEDLYTAPPFRHRGVATALVAHCVDDARHRGASVITVGADADDTPKEMYAALGFRPIAVHRSYVLTR